MKKFMFLYLGAWEPENKKMKNEWGEWFASIGSKIVDSGSPFGSGREITHSGTSELPVDHETITGYTIINAESMDEAQEIASSCPIVSGVRVYEAISM